MKSSTSTDMQKSLIGFDSQYIALAAVLGGGDGAWSIVCHFRKALNLSRILASKY
jgi:hypothetical protein